MLLLGQHFGIDKNHQFMTIDVLDKFSYLILLLEGPAADCIEGLPVTAYNYSDVVKLLQK